MPAPRPPTLPILTAALGVALHLAGCAPAIEATSSTGGADFVTGVQHLASDNGLSANGLSANGLSANGLFSTWFNQTLATAPAVMQYLYACAAPLGSTLTWTNPATGVAYRWIGWLGLAPDWAAGASATVAEQQLVSACLAAHVNKFGVHIPIAVEGRTAKGVQITIGAGELTTFSNREACFFGNLFTGQGIFAGLDHSVWANPQSSARACAFDNTSSGAPAVDCLPLVYVGLCNKICKADASKTFYESCTYNGVTYKPLVTRIRSAEIYTCGDGVCQFTEKCGTRAEWWQCKDCGPCP